MSINERIQKPGTLDLHVKEVIRGTGVALILKGAQVILFFWFNILIARFLGAEGLGLFSLSFTITMVVALLGRMGLDNALVKFIAIYADKGDWPRVKGTFRRALSSSFIACIILTAIVFVFAPVISKFFFNKPDLVLPLRILVLATIPFSLLNLTSESVRALKKIKNAILIHGQGLLVSIFTIPVFFITWKHFGIAAPSYSFLFSTILVLPIAIFTWKNSTPYPAASSAIIDTPELFKTAIPLLFIAGMNFVMTWTDTVVLGVYRSTAEVGIYVAAMRLATLVSFILWAGNSILAPKYATLYSNGRMDELQSLVRTITRLMAFLALFPLVVFLVFSAQLLSIFGPEFVLGKTSLIVLSIGQFVNTAVGSVGHLLMMTGNEWTFNNIFFSGVILNLILNILLVPSFGITGAAVATTTSMVIWNISAMIATRVKINIKTLI